MTRGLNLYKRYTQAELTAMREAICADPANKNITPGCVYLYVPKARKQIDDIAWAIRYHMEDKRAVASSNSGEQVKVV